MPSFVKKQLIDRHHLHDREPHNPQHNQHTYTAAFLTREPPYEALAKSRSNVASANNYFQHRN